MLENAKKISNPLTVIGMFAMLSEIAGTVTIRLLSEKLQEKFLYFLLFFPFTLVGLFFLVLLIKPEAFYSPSDYKTDDAFLRSLLLKRNKEMVDAINSIDSENDSKTKNAKIEEIKANLQVSNDLLSFFNIKGLSVDEYNVFACLTNSSDGLTLEQISNETGYSHKALNEILKKLASSNRVINQNGTYKSLTDTNCTFELCR